MSGWYAVDMTCSMSFEWHHFAKSSDVNCEPPSVMIFFILFDLANACTALMVVVLAACDVVAVHAVLDVVAAVAAAVVAAVVGGTAHF